MGSYLMLMVEGSWVDVWSHLDKSNHPAHSPLSAATPAVLPEGMDSFAASGVDGILVEDDGLRRGVVVIAAKGKEGRVSQWVGEQVKRARPVSEWPLSVSV